MSITGPELEQARCATNLSLEAVARALGLSPEIILAAEQEPESEQAITDRLEAFYVTQGLLPSAEAKRATATVSIVDEVERMGAEIEERPGLHSDPAY